MLVKPKSGFSVILMAILFVAVLTGCAASHQKAERVQAPTPAGARPNKLKIAIVPAVRAPYIQCVAFDKGRGRAAAKGAKELGKKGLIGGVTLPVRMLLEGGAADPRAAAVIFVLLPVLVPVCGVTGAVIGSSAGAIGGAIKGDYTEMPMNSVTDLKAPANSFAAISHLDAALASCLENTGRELTTNEYIVGHGDDGNVEADVVIRVNVARLLFKGELERDPDINFEMTVNIDVMDSTGSVHFSDRFNCQSDTFELSDWIEDEGLPLDKEFDHCYREISRDIIIKLFVLK